MDVMAKAANDIKYLLDRGYPQQGAICYVCDHYRLDINVRYILTRVVLSGDTVVSRRAKTVGCENINGTEVWIDGYNILIGVRDISPSLPFKLFLFTRTVKILQIKSIIACINQSFL